MILQRHIAGSKTNRRKLYEKHQTGDKWKFVVTLEETWLYISDYGAGALDGYINLAEKISYKPAINFDFQKLPSKSYLQKSNKNFVSLL